MFDLDTLSLWAVRWLPALLDAAIKGAILLALAALAVAILRKRSAAVRQLVWVLALGILLVLPLVSQALPAWQVLPSWAKWQAPAPPASPSAEEPPTDPGPNLGIAPSEFPAEIPPPIETRVAGPPTVVKTPIDAEPVASAEPQVAITSETSQAESPSPPAPPLAVRIGPWLMLAWAAGLLVCLAPLVLGRISLWRLARGAERIDGSWDELVHKASQALSLRSGVTLLMSHCEPMPMVWGVFRPKLLLPAEARNWSADRRWVVLLHELAHAKRRDCLAKIIAHLACAVYWFNPLCWMAFKRMQREAEAACDDLVLTAGHKPSDYAQHLLEIASGLKSGMLAAYSSIAMARQSEIEGRLLGILDGKRNRRLLTAWGLLIAALLMTAIALPLAIMRAATNEDKPTADKAVEEDPATQPAAALDAARAKAEKLVESLTNDDVRWGGTWIGLQPEIVGQSAKDIVALGHPALNALLSALRDKDKFAAAHVLMTRIVEPDFRFDSAAKWNGLRVKLTADNRTIFYPEHIPALVRSWQPTRDGLLLTDRLAEHRVRKLLSNSMPQYWRMVTRQVGTVEPVHWEPGRGVKLHWQGKGGEILVWMMRSGYTPKQNKNAPQGGAAVEVGQWRQRHVFLLGSGGDDWPTMKADVLAALKATDALATPPPATQPAGKAGGAAAGAMKAAGPIDSGWSKPVNGLRARVLCKKTTFDEGEPIEITLELQCFGEKDYDFPEKPLKRCQLFPHVNVRVGKQSKRVRLMAYNRVWIGKGKVFRRMLRLSELAAMDKPGKYAIRAGHSNHYTTDDGDWTGDAFSPPVTITVVQTDKPRPKDAAAIAQRRMVRQTMFNGRVHFSAGRPTFEEVIETISRQSGVRIQPNWVELGKLNLTPKRKLFFQFDRSTTPLNILGEALSGRVGFAADRVVYLSSKAEINRLAGKVPAGPVRPADIAWGKTAGGIRVGLSPRMISLDPGEKTLTVRVWYENVSRKPQEVPVHKDANMYKLMFGGSFGGKPFYSDFLVVRNETLPPRPRLLKPGQRFTETFTLGFSNLAPTPDVRFYLPGLEAGKSLTLRAAWTPFNDAATAKHWKDPRTRTSGAIIVGRKAAKAATRPTTQPAGKAVGVAEWFDKRVDEIARRMVFRQADDAAVDPELAKASPAELARRIRDKHVPGLWAPLRQFLAKTVDKPQLRAKLAGDILGRIESLRKKGKWSICQSGFLNTLIALRARRELLQLMENETSVNTCCGSESLMLAIVAMGRAEDAWPILRHFAKGGSEGWSSYLNGCMMRLTGEKTIPPGAIRKKSDQDDEAFMTRAVRAWAERLARANIGPRDVLHDVFDETTRQLAVMTLKEGTLWYEYGPPLWVENLLRHESVRLENENHPTSRLRYLPAGKAGWLHLRSNLAMTKLRQAAVSADRKHLAVVSVGEGHPILEVFDLPAMLGGKKSPPERQVDPYPGGIEIVGWEAGKLQVRSDMLLSHPTRDKNGRVPARFQMAEEWEYLLDMTVVGKAGGAFTATPASVTQGNKNLRNSITIVGEAFGRIHKRVAALKAQYPVLKGIDQAKPAHVGYSPPVYHASQWEFASNASKWGKAQTPSAIDASKPFCRIILIMGTQDVGSKSTRPEDDWPHPLPVADRITCPIGGNAWEGYLKVWSDDAKLAKAVKAIVEAELARVTARPAVTSKPATQPLTLPGTPGTKPTVKLALAEAARQRLVAQWERLYKHKPADRQRILTLGRKQVMKTITSEKDFRRLSEVRYWGASQHYWIVAEDLVPLLTDTTQVGLTNTRDLIIWERIKTRDLIFHGHGLIVDDDLFTVAGRASWLLKEITGHDPGTVTMKSTPKHLAALAAKWRGILAKLDKAKLGKALREIHGRVPFNKRKVMTEAQVREYFLGGDVYPYPWGKSGPPGVLRLDWSKKIGVKGKSPSVLVTHHTNRPWPGEQAGAQVMRFYTILGQDRYQPRIELPIEYVVSAPLKLFRHEGHDLVSVYVMRKGGGESWIFHLDGRTVRSIPSEDPGGKVAALLKENETFHNHTTARYCDSEKETRRFLSRGSVGRRDARGRTNEVARIEVIYRLEVRLQSSATIGAGSGGSVPVVR